MTFLNNKHECQHFDGLLLRDSNFFVSINSLYIFEKKCKSLQWDKQLKLSLHTIIIFRIMITIPAGLSPQKNPTQTAKKSWGDRPVINKRFVNC